MHDKPLTGIASDPLFRERVDEPRNDFDERSADELIHARMREIRRRNGELPEAARKLSGRDET